MRSVVTAYLTVIKLRSGGNTSSLQGAWIGRFIGKSSMTTIQDLSFGWRWLRFSGAADVWSLGFRRRQSKLLTAVLTWSGGLAERDIAEIARSTVFYTLLNEH